MTAYAILAGGCFWGMEELFRHLPGVTGTQVGYAGGESENPDYNSVSTGETGHAEALKITFSPEITSYRRILEFFFQIHDPTTPNRQGNDHGSQYRSLILYLDDTQKETAHQLMAEMAQSGKWPGNFITEVEQAGTFYPAEEMHQDYLQKHVGGYNCHFPRKGWVL